MSSANPPKATRTLVTEWRHVVSRRRDIKRQLSDVEIALADLAEALGARLLHPQVPLGERIAVWVPGETDHSEACLFVRRDPVSRAISIEELERE